MVIDVPEQKRYELRLDDGSVVGHAAYVLDGTRIELTHTVIDDGHEGEGLGSQLAGGVFADVREKGLEVVPTCSFMAGYVSKHPELVELVTPSLQADFR